MRDKKKMAKTLGDRLRGDGIKSLSVGKRDTPLWKGPYEDGITQSMLGRFLVCKERFRLYVCEGLKTSTGFDHKIEYGNMWHFCEELYHKGEPLHIINMLLIDYCRKLHETYPTAGEQIDKWYNVCWIQFPLYVEYWKRYNRTNNIYSLIEEKVFKCRYLLPSGRVVVLRGKIDSSHHKNKGIWLQENKTKGDIREDNIRRQLRCDLQTMIYLVALEDIKKEETVRGVFPYTKQSVNERWYSPIDGVLYNVVRRPLSGGKGTIIQKKGSKNVPPESKSQYYKRLQGVIKEDISSYFMRWEVPVTSNDVKNFKDRVLNPILEHLCDWWDWISYCYQECKSPFISNGTNNIHWLHPFGVSNTLNEGGSSDMDSFLETGNEVGLIEVNNLFPELDV